jgi:hypothetical protein
VHRAPAVVVQSGMTVDGWIPVDSLTLDTSFPGVYAIGDVAAVGTPRAGVFAEGHAAVAAERIAAQIRGTTSSAQYGGRGICYLEFGRGEVGLVDVTFFGDQREGKLTGPSRALAADKTEFGSSRIKRWFGRDGRRREVPVQAPLCAQEADPNNAALRVHRRGRSSLSRPSTQRCGFGAGEDEKRPTRARLEAARDVPLPPGRERPKRRLRGAHWDVPGLLRRTAPSTPERARRHRPPTQRHIRRHDVVHESILRPTLRFPPGAAAGPARPRSAGLRVRSRGVVELSRAPGRLTQATAVSSVGQPTYRRGNGRCWTVHRVGRAGARP